MRVCGQGMRLWWRHGGVRARNIEEEEKMSRERRTRESIVGGGLAEDGGLDGCDSQ